ncbi:hypothetical protein AMTRI_Chr05g70520 [Amborella trichopoda]
MLSRDFRIALVQALSYTEVYEIEVEPIEVDPAILNNYMVVTFLDDDLQLGGKFHNRPLFVTGELHVRPINRIMIDGGSAINLIPRRILTCLGLGSDDLTPTNITVQRFNQLGEKPAGIVCLRLKIGALNDYSQFHVIDTDTLYNILLGCPWMHDKGVVPSTLHQRFKHSRDGRQYKVYADKRQFPITKTHYVDAKYYFADLVPS